MKPSTAQLALDALKELRNIVQYFWDDENSFIGELGLACGKADSAIAALDDELAQPAGPEEPIGFVANHVLTELKTHATQACIYLANIDSSLVPIYAARKEPAVNADPGYTGMSDEADFKNNTWTFKMDPGYMVGAGQYMITRIAKTAPKATS